MSNNFRAFEFGIRIGNLAADPVTGKLGEVYINNVSNLPRFYNGTLWVDLSKNEYLDTEFRINDDGDPTRKIAFEAAAIATGTTRTIIMPDNDVDLTGMVSGPIASTDNAIVRFDGVTGKLIKDSNVLIDNSDNITGVASLIISGAAAGFGLQVIQTGATGYGARTSLTNALNPDDVLELSTDGTGNHLSTPKSASAQTEDLRIATGNQTGTGGFEANSGAMFIGSGTSDELNTGSVNVFSGAALFAAALSGDIAIYSGDSDGNSGTLGLTSGDSASGDSGNVNILTGGAAGVSGNITIATGIGGTSDGKIFLNANGGGGAGDIVGAANNNISWTADSAFSAQAGSQLNISANSSAAFVSLNDTIVDGVEVFGTTRVKVGAGTLTCNIIFNPSASNNIKINASDGGALEIYSENGVWRTSDDNEYVVETYISGFTLTASTTAVATPLTLDNTTWDGCIIDYKIKEAITGEVRIGQLYVASNGTTVSITDTFTETADVGVTWTAAMNGSDIEISYTTTANNKTMQADYKKFTFS